MRCYPHFFVTNPNNSREEFNRAMSEVMRKKSYVRIPDILDLPRLIEVQLNSFEYFKREGLGEILAEISPIASFNKNLELHFLRCLKRKLACNRVEFAILLAFYLDSLLENIGFLQV